MLIDFGSGGNLLATMHSIYTIWNPNHSFCKRIESTSWQFKALSVFKITISQVQVFAVTRRNIKRRLLLGQKHA